MFDAISIPFGSKMLFNTVRLKPGVSMDDVELALGEEGDAELGDAIRARLRDVLVVQTQVELVPFGTLERSEYKSTLLDRKGS